MTFKRLRQGILAATVWAGASGLLLADPALVLSPTGAMTGAPGATVGWGWSFSNDTPYYIEFSSNQFCDAPVILTPVLVCNAPTTGTYQDIILGNDPIIAPNTTTPVENFDAVTLSSGVGYFQIDPGAAPGSSDIGQIVLTYDEYTLNPNDPNCQSGCQVGFDIPVGADASVTVSQVFTPEPGSGALALAGLAGGLLWRRRRETSAWFMKTLGNSDS